MQPTIGIITNDRKSAGRSIKELIAEARILLDKLDDAFEVWSMTKMMLLLMAGLPCGKSKGDANPKIKVQTKTISFYLPFKWLQTLEAVINLKRL